MTTSRWLVCLLMVAAASGWAQETSDRSLATPKSGGNWCALSDRACGIRGLPSSVVEGIIMVESGGWPYAIAVNKGGRHHGFYPETLAEAKLVLRLALAWTSNVGIGLMQVNWHWWGETAAAYGLEAVDLLEPRTNIRMGCLILRAALTEGSGSFASRLGLYHTRRRQQGEQYASKVLRVAREVEMLREKRR